MSFLSSLRLQFHFLLAKYIPGTVCKVAFLTTQPRPSLCKKLCLPQNLSGLVTELVGSATQLVELVSYKKEEEFFF